MLQWSNPEQLMENEEERMYNETAAQSLQEVSLPIAIEAGNVIVMSSSPISLVTAGPSVSTPFLPPMNDEGIPSSVSQFISQSKRITSGSFGGFKFSGNFQA